MTVPITPPPSLRKIGIERAETNRPREASIDFPARTFVRLFGEALLAELSARGKSTPPTP